MYALVKSLKDFRFYVLHSHIISYVLGSVVKCILTQLDQEGKITKWMVLLLEYDIEIKPTKMIKGQGLAKRMTNSNYDSLQLNLLTSHLNQLDIEVHVIPDFSISPWYSNIVYVPQNVHAPAELRKTRAQSIKLKSTKFCILNKYLYWKDLGSVLLNFILGNEAQQNIKEFHKGD